MRAAAIHRRGVATALTALALALLPAACGSDDDNGGGDAGSAPAPAEPEQPLSPAEEQGRELFVDTCGSCHTLDAAGTQGSIGPNLDEAQVNEADVLAAIENGGKGSGNMPAGLLSGEEARNVAAFVAGSGPGP